MTDALLARVLRSADPGAALEIEIARASPPLAEILRRIQPDGLRISALLIARLRFERLLQGSAEAAAAFAADPAAFTRRFRAYHLAIPPTAVFAQDEGALFTRWHSREEKEGPGGSVPPGPRSLLGDTYWLTAVTIPAPTVREPSRTAKREPTSKPAGRSSATCIATRSPGCTRTPSGRLTVPVTSVVPK